MPQHVSLGRGKVQATGSTTKRAAQGKLAYTVDWSIPLSDTLVEPAALEEYKLYLQEHLKIDGKTGQLGDRVKVEVNGSIVTISMSSVCFEISFQKIYTTFVDTATTANTTPNATQVLFAKRAIKFFTRKFLIKQKLRDYLRPIATDKVHRWITFSVPPETPTHITHTQYAYEMRYYNIALDDDEGMDD